MRELGHGSFVLLFLSASWVHHGGYPYRRLKQSGERTTVCWFEREIAIFHVDKVDTDATCIRGMFLWIRMPCKQAVGTRGGNGCTAAAARSVAVRTVVGCGLLALAADTWGD